MDRSQAIALVRETFTGRFDEPRFTLFVRNLVNHLDESKKQVWTLKKDAFKDYVNHFTRLGTYTDPRGERVDVAVVAVDDGSLRPFSDSISLAVPTMKYALHKKDQGQMWWWDSVRGKWTNLRPHASRFTYREARKEQARVGGSMTILWQESQPLTSNIPF